MRVLIATDGLAHSDIAAHLGAQISQFTGTIPTILTVIRRKADKAQADATLTHTFSFMTPNVSDVQTRIRMGRPAEEIAHEAVEGNYDLIIMGRRPTHNLLRRFLGSTSERVIEQAPCPVIIAKGKVDALHRFLVCDSGAESPSLLNRFTVQLADLLTKDTEVTILHVMSQMSAGPGVKEWQLRASAKELMQANTPEGYLLNQDIQVLERSNIHTIPKVRHGLVVDEILDEAQKGDYDLVVIGVPKGEGWQRLLLDNLAYQIITFADRPVLVLK